MENKVSAVVRETNLFFRKANRADIDRIRSAIILSDRQEKIFDMFFIKRLDGHFIADSVGLSPTVVYREIGAIRCKIHEVLSAR